MKNKLKKCFLVFNYSMENNCFDFFLSLYKTLNVIIWSLIWKTMRYKKCRDREKNLLYHIFIYIFCFIKCKYTYNINILNIILYTYNYFLVVGER